MCIPDFGMPFNPSLARDEEPLLFHVMFQGMLPALWEALVMLIDPVKFSHITWRHLASDESDALNDRLQLAPQAQPVCANVGKLMSVDDFFVRLTSWMTPDDVPAPGEHCYRFQRSPRISHGRDLGLFVDPCFKHRTRHWTRRANKLFMLDPLPQAP